MLLKILSYNLLFEYFSDGNLFYLNIWVQYVLTKNFYKVFYIIKSNKTCLYIPYIIILYKITYKYALNKKRI